MIGNGVMITKLHWRR